MNERIRELAEQAAAWVAENHQPQDPNAYSQKEIDQRYLMYEEKFAELIVQDVLNICHDIARPQSNGDDHKFTPGAKAVDKLVRKFYGVEE